MAYRMIDHKLVLKHLLRAAIQNTVSTDIVSNNALKRAQNCKRSYRSGWKIKAGKGKTFVLSNGAVHNNGGSDTQFSKKLP